MTKSRAPSPQICAECFLLHIRLPRDLRLLRRKGLEDAGREMNGEQVIYALSLFDHLTLAGKQWMDERDPNHPVPVIPENQDARWLRRTVRETLYLTYDDLRRPSSAKES